LFLLGAIFVILQYARLFANITYICANVTLDGK
jgi:hypothetical protein